jgi:hypothetical protein
MSSADRRENAATGIDAERAMLFLEFSWASSRGFEGGDGHVVEVGGKSRVGDTARIMEARALRDGGSFRA